MREIKGASFSPPSALKTISPDETEGRSRAHGLSRKHPSLPYLRVESSHRRDGRLGLLDAGGRMTSSGLRLVQGDPEVDFSSIAKRQLGFEDRLGLGKFSLKIGAFKPARGRTSCRRTSESSSPIADHSTWIGSALQRPSAIAQLHAGQCSRRWRRYWLLVPHVPIGSF
jgi:hypothetical protein